MIRFLGLALFLLLFSCSELTDNHRTYQTWESMQQEPQGARLISKISGIDQSRFLWAGTVSHHLLSYRQIDDWFKLLRSNRDVKTFFILSPSHWGLSTQDVSMTDGSWLTKDGKVQSDREKVNLLQSTLGYKLDERAFDPEHGVSTLVPFVRRYFGDAKIVALLFKGEPPLDQKLADRILRALEPFFVGPAAADNFLLISTDFAHHGNLEGTTVKDARTMLFFDKPNAKSWIYAGCDNRPGMYILGHLVTDRDRVDVLYHTNSFELSGEGETDITSYFFSFFSRSRS